MKPLHAKGIPPFWNTSRSASPQRRTSLLPYADHNPTQRTLRRQGAPAAPPGWLPTSPSSMSTTRAPMQSWVLFDERSDLTVGFRARPAMFRHRRRTGSVLVGPLTRPSDSPWTKSTHTCLTGRAVLAGTDHYLQRCILVRVVARDQINFPHAYQLLLHARRTSFHRGSPASDIDCSNPIVEDPSSLLADSAP